jgi:hypothetical protein
MHYVFACLLAFSFPFTYSALPSSSQPVATANTDSLVDVSSLRAEEVARLQFEDSVTHLYQALELARYDLSYTVFRYGMIGYNLMQQQGKLGRKNLLTIIDFTKPSSKKRFYTIDLGARRVKYHTYVSHGRNTGENEAKAFSNIVHSNQSSLGFYTTAETYVGTKGYSLKLDGLEKGYNDKVRERAVVIHEADYVSESWIRKYGRLGRSQGCPALSKEVSREIIDGIKHQTLIFAYYNDPVYLQTSAYLNMDQLISNITLTARK